MEKKYFENNNLNKYNISYLEKKETTSIPTYIPQEPAKKFSLDNLPKALQHANFKESRIVKSENYILKEGIDKYLRALKDFGGETLQEMQGNLNAQLDFFRQYSDEQLKAYFEGEFGVSVGSKRDLEHLAFAVSERLQKLEDNEERKEERKLTVQKEKNKRALIKSLVITGIMGAAGYLLMQPLSPPAPKDILNYSVGIEKMNPSSEEDFSYEVRTRDDGSHEYIFNFNNKDK